MNQRVVHAITTAALATACLAGSAGAFDRGAILPPLRWFELDEGDGTGSTALGAYVDGDGHVVAIVGMVNVGGIDQPAYWEQDTEGLFELTMLPLDVGWQGGRAESVIVDDSDYGVIASGWILDSAGQERPCAWTRVKTGEPFVQALLLGATFGGKSTSVDEMEGSGGRGPGPVLIGFGGWVFDAMGVQHAAIWTGPPAGPWLPAPVPSSATEDSWVNDLTPMEVDWLAVGFEVDDQNVHRPVRWRFDGFDWLGPFAYPISGADGNGQAKGITTTNGIGNAATSVGYVADGGVTRAFAWEFISGGGWSETNLATLPAFSHSRALDVTVWNPTGALMAVGRSYTGPGPLAGLATLWQEADGVPPVEVFDLNSPTITINLPTDVTLRRANHIADRTHPGSFGTGEFVVVGAFTRGPRGDGQTTHACVLMPPPLPAIPTMSQWGLLALALAIVGAGSIVLRRARRA